MYGFIRLQPLWIRAPADETTDAEAQDAELAPEDGMAPNAVLGGSLSNNSDQTRSPIGLDEGFEMKHDKIAFIRSISHFPCYLRERLACRMSNLPRGVAALNIISSRNV
jgi:hypothetical protein